MWMLVNRQPVHPNAPPSLAGESDTESDAGVSESDFEVEVVEPTAVVEPMVFDSRPSQFHAAFASLDVVDLKELSSNRAAVMRSVPSFLRGAFRTTMRVALTELVKGIDEQSNVRMTRGWKLFLLLPRLLHKPVRGELPRRLSRPDFTCSRWVNGTSWMPASATQPRFTRGP